MQIRSAANVGKVLEVAARITVGVLVVDQSCSVQRLVDVANVVDD